jgi:hypothetical protein
MQSHTISHLLKIFKEKGFLMPIRWLKTEACSTPLKVFKLLKYIKVVVNVSSGLFADFCRSDGKLINAVMQTLLA